MKRIFAGLMCTVMLVLAAFSFAAAEDMDEQELLKMAQETDAPIERPTTIDYVYAISDAKLSTDETVIDQGEIPEYAQHLLAIASAEIGYQEGSNGYTKYGEWSGDPNAEWCAEFICWSINQVDEQYGTSLLEVVYPNWRGQNTGKNWFIKRGRFVFRKGMCPDWGSQWLLDSYRLLAKNEYIPYPGDLVYFSYNDSGDTEHVALVEYCTRDADYNVVMHVIEGNNPSAVQRNTYMLDNSQVLGFGVHQDLISTTMRSGNVGDKVLQLQEKLNLLGLLGEESLTGAYAGNTKAAVMAFQADWMLDKASTGVADRQTQIALDAKVTEYINKSPDSWEVVD